MGSELDFLNPIAGIINAGTSIGNSIAGTIIAGKNYDLKMEQYNYQKEMQKQAWAREDNAVQRRIADLKAAGLSPVLAAGSAASSSAPINVTAPQRENAPLNLDAVAVVDSMNRIAQTKAQTKLTEMEALKKEYEYKYMRDVAEMPPEYMDIWGKRLLELITAFKKGSDLTPQDWLTPSEQKKEDAKGVAIPGYHPKRMTRSSDLEN